MADEELIQGQVQEPKTYSQEEVKPIKWLRRSFTKRHTHKCFPGFGIA